MNFTLHQLQVFLKICELGSITKAAETLHLTQPAVSIQLRNFQQQFDIPLTETIGRHIYITDFGREIAAAAGVITGEVKAIHQTMLAHKGQLTGTLKLSVVSTGKYVMPYFLAGFLRQHPGVELKMDVTNKSRVLESLEKNEVDFALVSVLPRQPSVRKVELMKNKLFLVGNSSQPFRKKQYDKTIFEQLPLIYREPGSGTRLVMEQFIEKNRLPVQKKMELTSNEAVKQAVIAGLGYSIMPLIGIRQELNSGLLRIIPVKGFPIQSVWNLIWLSKKQHAPAAAAYLDFLRQEKQAIIQEQFSWLENS